jgi:hypothetical protein
LAVANRQAFDQFSTQTICKPRERTVNLESNLDLGLTSGSRGDVGQVEFTELVVVLGHGSFTLEDLDGNGGLVVDGSREDLGLLGGDDSVPCAVIKSILDQLS